MQKHVSAAELQNIVLLEQRAAAGPEAARSGRAVARIQILGPMRATSYLGSDILPRGRKARAILGCLCLAGGNRLPRGRLAALLWDRVSEFQARASFRQSFRELVVAFGPLAKDLIFADRETIGLKTSDCWIDALAVLAPEFAESAHRSELAAHCQGELLEELAGISIAFDHWLLSERTRFTERRRALLEDELSHARGDNAAANERAEIARRLIMFDPTHEGASRVLMRALADMAERGQALREFARCRDALKSALDVEPSLETVALYEAIRMFSGPEKDEPAPPAPAPRKKNAKPKMPEPNRNRLRVGVLPFLATGALGNDGLALSLSQEIGAGLARFRWFDVISPMALMNRPPLALISEESLRPNELDYVIDGAISGAGGKYQINVRLLDLTKYASPVWSERFELGIDELYRLDEVVAPIVGRIDPLILFIEGQPKQRDKAGATSLIMQAMPMIYSWEREKFEKAGALINQALKIEPDNAMVLAWAAHWRMSHVGQAWTKNAARELEAAEQLCIKATRIDPDNAEALGIYAHICSWKREFDDALHYFDRALRSNPNLAFVWALSAITYCYVGKPNETLKRMERYRALAPFDPYFCHFESIYCTAYLLRGDYKEAIVYGRRSAKANPQFINGYKPLIASLGHLGELEEARSYIDKVLALEPGFTVKQFGENYPFKNSVDRDRYCDGLRLAGVPEG
jgi:DNA-binding SARP family transcriptional activator/TolB-like protein/cytochrome c-type biogenesis protein CcmH/NrfG